MRIWFKMMKNNHLLRDTTITDESDETRTHKVFHAKARFYQDSFVDSIDFDFLEMQVIEED